MDILKLLKIRGKDKNQNRNLMSFHICNDQLLKKYKIFLDLDWRLKKNIELIALPVFNDRYLKTKIRTYVDKIYTNFHGLNVPEDGIERGSFTVISADFLLA